MTRFRWGLGASLCALSLVAAAKALATYVGHGLLLGSAAVVILGAIAVVGFGSLALARLRLARELAALAAEPPTGELFCGRKKRLEAHRAASGMADASSLSALAQASAAEETGRAYLGRYLVAVTVLVGLVGTFAGLMETLRGVAPLVGEGEAATLHLIAAPLAGLDVTFGASIVGILVTLALALVQGDLVLAEELALARLEERTALTIVPSLWPPVESAVERAARDLSSLRGELTSFVGRTVKETSTRVGEVAATQVERLVRELKHLLGDSARASAAEVRAGLRGVSDEATAQLRALVAAETQELAKLRETTTAQTAAMASALEVAARDTAAAQERILEGAAKQSASMASSLEAASRNTAAAQQTILDRAAAQAASLEQASQDAIARSEAALTTLAERHASKLDATAQAIVGALDRSAATVENAAGETGRELRALGERHASRLDQAAAGLLESFDRSIGAHGARLDGIAAAVEKAAKAATTGGAALQHATAEQAGMLQHAVAESASRTSAAVAVSAARTGAQLAEVGAQQAARIEELTGTLVAALEKANHAHASRLDAIAATVEKSAQATAEARAELHAADSLRAAQLGSAVEQATTRTAAELDALGKAHAEKLDETTRALLAAVQSSVGESGSRLDQAAATLLRAADGLRDGASALGPQVATLGPELAALSHELALLAARADASHDPTTLLDELQRLGDGVDRLEGLVRLGQSS
jgi:hypothetical protein